MKSPLKQADALAQLIDTVAWIDKRFSHLAAPCDERALRAIGHFDNALHNQASVALVGALHLTASVDSVLRSLFEELVRGLWMSHCATRADLSRLRKGRRSPSIPRMLAFIQELPEPLGDALPAVTQFGRLEPAGTDPLDFYYQLIRRARGLPKEPFNPSQVRHAYLLANAFGLLAATAVAELAGDQKLVHAGIERSTLMGFSPAPGELSGARSLAFDPLSGRNPFEQPVRIPAVHRN